MHTTTFYSYKGGVGRTLALMNVASGLVSDGENVFLIDFDLEAPGMQTFDIFQQNGDGNQGASEQLGLSDLIYKYMSDPAAGLPDISDYVIEGASLHLASDDYAYRRFAVEKPGKIFLLPAGTRRAYAQIDWQRLYEDQEGFFFFEMLKSTIAKHEKYAPMWLLIDSRTGRAETTGICTRQLADTNVLVFFPNEQNRIGFEEVFPQIRDEPSRKVEGVDPCNFIFVASRVPIEDDEDAVLAEEMEKFTDVFGLQDDPIKGDFMPKNILKLPHNNSVDLVAQVLFIKDRPKSTLGQAYASLTHEIQKLNSDSSFGSVRYLDSLFDNIKSLERGPSRDSRQPRQMTDFSSSLKEVSKHLLDIAYSHPFNDQINALLAKCYGELSFKARYNARPRNFPALALWHGLMCIDLADFREINLPASLHIAYSMQRYEFVTLAFEEGYEAFEERLSMVANFAEAFGDLDEERQIKLWSRFFSGEAYEEALIEAKGRGEKIYDGLTRFAGLEFKKGDGRTQVEFDLSIFEDNLKSLLGYTFDVRRINQALTLFEWLVLTDNHEKFHEVTKIPEDGESVLYQVLRRTPIGGLRLMVEQSINNLSSVEGKPQSVRNLEELYAKLLIGFNKFSPGARFEDDGTVADLEVKLEEQSEMMRKFERRFAQTKSLLAQTEKSLSELERSGARRKGDTGGSED